MARKKAEVKTIRLSNTELLIRIIVNIFKIVALKIKKLKK